MLSMQRLDQVLLKVVKQLLDLKKKNNFIWQKLKDHSIKFLAAGDNSPPADSTVYQKFIKPTSLQTYSISIWHINLQISQIPDHNSSVLLWQQNS